MFIFREDPELMSHLSELYFDTTDPVIDENALPVLAEIFTDSWFQMPTILTAKKIAEKAKSHIFLYYYTYPGTLNMCDLVNLDIFKFSVTVSKQPTSG